MSTAAPPTPRARLRVPPALERLAARPSPFVPAVAGGIALTLLSLHLRTRALDAGFWIDEALAVGVASNDLTDIPSVLKLDGSPPLYYALLHGWMQMFGSTESATHWLSVVFAVLTVPVALWAGRTLFGRTAGWAAAALAAINPFLTYYAQETRMYSLLALLGLLVAATFLKAFTDRDRRFLAPFALSLAAIIYTHNWGLFLGVGTVAGLALLVRWAAPDARRPLVRDALLAYGATGLLFLPWVPTLLFQARHTGAPWAERPDFQALRESLGQVLGGPTPGIALLLVAGSGIVGLVRDRHDRRATVLLAMTLTAVALAWLASQVNPAFSTRYFAAFVGPMLLLAAAGLTNAGRLGLVCFLVVVTFWFTPRTAAIEHKSNARSVAASIQTIVTTGDVVVSTQPEALPLVAYYLPQGVRYATTLGPAFQPAQDVGVFDWRDALDRLRDAKPRPTVNRIVRTLKEGQELVLVEPILRTARWGAPWTSLVRKRTVQWERRLDADRRVRREAVVPVFGFDPIPRGIRAVVYRRVG
jgi:uncharacterized membrane protein